jgi:hypothetical protein
MQAAEISIAAALVSRHRIIYLEDVQKLDGSAGRDALRVLHQL